MTYTKMVKDGEIVTILVLVDSVLQYPINVMYGFQKQSHNPCFSGQCFAISRNCITSANPYEVTILVLVDSVLQ